MPFTSNFIKSMIKNKVFLVWIGLSVFSFASCQTDVSQKKSNHINTGPTIMDTNYTKTEAEWKKTLSDDQYRILREKGTEYPHTGKYNLHFEKGSYSCAGCGYELFKDDQKFESHCGWPSFGNEIGNGERIKKIRDTSHGMIRTEIVCARCGGHLGHIFDDGPTTTGLRYCVNSLSLNFTPANSDAKK